MTSRRWIGILVGVVLAFGAVLATGVPANAGTGTACLGTGCDGLDPSRSFNASTGVECNTSASTVHSEPAFDGTLELRWGPNCSTNWTRFTPADKDNGTYEIWVTRLSDGVWAGDGKFNPYVFSGGGTWYSDQVYSPGPAAACVLSFALHQEICYNQPA